LTAKNYQTPSAFKTALEARLRKRSGNRGSSLRRERQLVVFSRLLVRLNQEFADMFILKGGLALEFRIQEARTTREVDLGMMGSPEKTLQRLQTAGRIDAADYMTFEIERGEDLAGLQVQYVGHRYRALPLLAGKEYGARFGIDIVFGEPFYGAPDVLSGDDSLSFIHLPAPLVRLCPVVTHIAEKLHAYSYPRVSNSRTKDLPDLALLARLGALDSTELRGAINQTFSNRHTHEVPRSVPDPPASWKEVYAALAEEDSLPWSTLSEVIERVREFLNPVLAEERFLAEWRPRTWSWKGLPLP
jgi:Nucleotidyl transferase AbiEii toxin, Type IV TA system